MPIQEIGTSHIRATTDDGRPWDVRLIRDDLWTLGPEVAPDLLGDVGGSDPRRAVIADSRLAKLHKAELPALFMRYGVLPQWIPVIGGEGGKTISGLATILDQLSDLGLPRRSPIYVIGGGAVTDTGRLAVALLDRGHPAISIPTTVVGLVDAGPAAKNGVNHRDRKNLVGTYDPPSLTLLWLGWLRTLPQKHIAYGLAEVAKALLPVSAAGWSLFEQHAGMMIKSGGQAGGCVDLVWSAVTAIVPELVRNRREDELMRWPDFGHTLTHSAELRSRMHHGWWVAIDIAVTAVLSEMRGILASEDRRRVTTGLRALGLALSHPLLASGPFLASALDTTRKHRGGDLHIPVLTGLGAHTFLEDVTVDELLAAGRQLHEEEEGQG